MIEEFKEGVSSKTLELGPKAGTLLRVEHRALPGRPVLAFLDPGYPDSALQEKRQACIMVLHADFIELTQEFDIL